MNQENNLGAQSNTGAAGKKIKHIKGICCNVKNCAYHDGESCCTAKAVHIGPMQAQSSVDTICATFRSQG